MRVARPPRAGVPDVPHAAVAPRSQLVWFPDTAAPPLRGDTSETPSGCPKPQAAPDPRPTTPVIQFELSIRPRKRLATITTEQLRQHTVVTVTSLALRPHEAQYG